MPNKGATKLSHLDNLAWNSYIPCLHLHLLIVFKCLKCCATVSLSAPTVVACVLVALAFKLCVFNPQATTVGALRLCKCQLYIPHLHLHLLLVFKCLNCCVIVSFVTVHSFKVWFCSMKMFIIYTTVI